MARQRLKSNFKKEGTTFSDEKWRMSMQLLMNMTQRCRSCIDALIQKSK